MLSKTPNVLNIKNVPIKNIIENIKEIIANTFLGFFFTFFLNRKKIHTIFITNKIPITINRYFIGNIFIYNITPSSNNYDIIKSIPVIL